MDKGKIPPEYAVDRVPRDDGVGEIDLIRLGKTATVAVVSVDD